MCDGQHKQEKLIKKLQVSFVSVATPASTIPVVFSVYESWQHCFFLHCDWVSCNILCVVQ